MKKPESWYLTQIEYGRACLEYTFESIRNQELRINLVLLLTATTLGLNRLVLEQVEALQGAPVLKTIAQWWLFAASIPLLAGIVVGILALRSRVFDATSQMLPEWIEQQDREAYVKECTTQKEQAILRKLMTENHALSQAKVFRTRRYRTLSGLFVLGALPLVALYAAFLLSAPLGTLKEYFGQHAAGAAAAVALDRGQGHD